MTEHQAIEQELQDLSGVLADIYRQAALAFTGSSGGSARGAHI